MDRVEFEGDCPIGVVIVGGHFQGLGALRSLAKRRVPVCVLDHDLCISRFSRYPKRVLKCPDVRQESAFLEFLVSLARKKGMLGWLIYPNDDETVSLLSKHRERLLEYYRVVTPQWDITRHACEKRLTYLLAKKCGIPTPVTVSVDHIEDLDYVDIRFPAILKPSAKEPFYRLTRKKAIRVDDRAHLMLEFRRATSIVGASELLVQELIPGGPRNLYSVGSLFKSGQFLGRVVARRPRQHPMDFGHATTYAVTVDIPELEETTRRILSAIGYYGLSEVEFMFDPRDRQYKLIEINPRLWGWHTLAIEAGVDLPYLQYRDALGMPVASRDFDSNVKWVRLVTDLPTALGEVFGGRMTLAEYVRTLGGRKQLSVLSQADPLPFVAELFMLPYLRIKRGF